MEPQNEKQSFNLPEGKVTANTMSRETYNGKQGPKAELQSWPDGFKLQGPMASTTCYNVNGFLDLESVSESWRF